MFGRVESAGGTVKVWSAPGSGTSVLFTLPLLPEPGVGRRRSHRDQRLDEVAAGCRPAQLVHRAADADRVLDRGRHAGARDHDHLLGLVVEPAAPVRRHAILPRRGLAYRPQRATELGPGSDSRDAAGILALACAGLVVSALGTYGGTVPIAQWWPGIALSATFVSIAPYCTPRKQLICSIPLIVFSGIVGWLVFSSQTDFWPPAALVIIAVGPVTIGAAGGVVFGYTVVSRTLALLDTSAGVEEFYATSDASDAEQQRNSIARVSARVAPFLETRGRGGQHHAPRTARSPLRLRAGCAPSS